MDKEKNRNSNKIKIIVLCIISISLIGTIFIFNKNQSNVNVSGGILHEGIIPGYTEEQIKEIMQREADESTFSFEINSRPIFKDGKSEGKIEPNHYIEYAKLTKKLKAGEYNATATINAYDTKTGDFKGTSSAKLIIKIEN